MKLENTKLLLNTQELSYLEISRWKSLKRALKWKKNSEIVGLQKMYKMTEVLS